MDPRLKDIDLDTYRPFVRRKEGSLSTHRPIEGDEPRAVRARLREGLPRPDARSPYLSGARILIEASAWSVWVARFLERLGHEVIVADTNFAPMYATRSRHVKTDTRDARPLAVLTSTAAPQSPL